MSPIKKGEYMGECNRTACNTKDAQYYNHSTRSFYCPECANLINNANAADAHRMFGHELCTLKKTLVPNVIKNFTKLFDISTDKGTFEHMQNSITIAIDSLGVLIEVKKMTKNEHIDVELYELALLTDFDTKIKNKISEL